MLGEGEDGAFRCPALWLRSRPMQEDPEQPEGPAPSPRGTGYKVTERDKRTLGSRASSHSPGVKRYDHSPVPFLTYTQERVKLSSNFHAASEHKDNRELVANSNISAESIFLPVT